MVKPMEPIILARSERRESASEDNAVWWCEYRLTYNEVKHRYEVETRYLSEIGGVVYARLLGKTDYAVDPCDTWEYWTHGETPEMAVDDVLGDSKFFRAESLSELHRECVQHVAKKLQEAERKRAIADAEAELGEAIQDLADWKDREERRFTIMHGDKPDAERAKAATRTRTKLEPTKNKYQERINEAREKLEKLKKS